VIGRSRPRRVRRILCYHLRDNSHSLVGGREFILPKQRHWHEQKLHDFSGGSRARRESRGNPWRFCPARCRRFDLGNARGDPKEGLRLEGLRLAHWLLGEIRDKWVELRHHAHRSESGDCHNRRWRSLARKVPRIALIRGETRAQSVVPSIPT
jgi:hypothetical protein